MRWPGSEVRRYRRGSGNPLEDIRLLENVKFDEGRIYK